MAQYAARWDVTVDFPAPPLVLITAITAIARAVQSGALRPFAAAPYCAVRAIRKDGFRLTPLT